MRQKFLYLSFLFIMILLLVLFNWKSKVVLPVKETNQQQVLNTENVSLLGDNKTGFLSSDKAGVTFFKKNKDKSPSEESLLPAAKGNFMADIPTQNSVSSGGGGSELPAKIDNGTKEESPGITKISKHPTAERKQQLSSKGILMF